MGAAWEEVKFKSADGTGLTGLWFPARGMPAKGVIVHFHGNGENMTSHYLFVYWLALEGYDVFSFDYRGYGASEGSKSISGAIEDGAAALRLARGRAGGARERLIVIGQSLGGAIALASLDLDGGEGVRGLILDSTFASYRAVARDKLNHVWLTWPFQYPLSYFLISERWAPKRLIARRKRVPLLMMHAVADPVVPYAQGRRLYELAPGPKEFWKIAGTGHTAAFFTLGPQYRPTTLAWLERVLAD
ncbi:MAG: alpha/beta hydrolase [Elusimicrobia bacterium CG11_big_fil_rev_8_21_14_0_20_64_6]|nr:MAG: alpha/beta hydrolase [Elusimicrobia bacterium CG11_big_fil_rev_8_21_14_0_20_64_6]